MTVFSGFCLGVLATASIIAVFVAGVAYGQRIRAKAPDSSPKG